MDVQAQDSELHQADTGALPASARTQAITFHDPVFSDTAPTPVVAFRPPEQRRADDAGQRVLRIAIVIVVLVLLGCGAVLGLVKSGVIDRPGGSGAGNGAGTHSAAAPTGPLAVPTGSGPQTASYAVDSAGFRLTIATGPGPAWVSVGLIGQHALFAGVLSPHTSKGFVLLGSSQAEVGAGGTTLTVTAGQRTSTLVPPSAPFTYQLNTQQPART